MSLPENENKQEQAKVETPKANEPVVKEQTKKEKETSFVNEAEAEASLSRTQKYGRESEREVLMNALEAKGIPYKRSMSNETLAVLLANYITTSAQDQEKEAKNTKIDPRLDPDSGQFDLAYYSMQLKNKAFALRRVRVTCLNPQKHDSLGEIFTVSNSLIGTRKRAVPFGDKCAEGYHMEQFMVDFLKEKKIQITRTTRNTKTGNLEVDPDSMKLVNEFLIEELPPLTQEDIDAMRERQAIRNATAIDI